MPVQCAILGQLIISVLSFPHNQKKVEGWMSDLDQIKAIDSGVAAAINAGDAAAVTAHYIR